MLALAFMPVTLALEGGVQTEGSLELAGYQLSQNKRPKKLQAQEKTLS